MSDGRHAAVGAVWFLEGYVHHDGDLVRAPLRPLPFRVGRRAGLELSLSSPSVSLDHAEIYSEPSGLWVRDLGSTNGTFLNRQQLLHPARLEDSDILHFADAEFRLVQDATLILPASSGTIEMRSLALPSRLGDGGREVRHLLENAAVTALYQPIVELANEELSGYETLCRGTWPTLPTDPGPLFAAAASVHLEGELSQLFRSTAVGRAAGHGDLGRLFLNTYPSELSAPGPLLASLAELRASLPGGSASLVLEIHESAVTDLAAMRELGAGLAALGIELAYDDFGAGQARLLELVEAPPAFLKFDISLVRGLHQASEGRRRMVSALVQMAHELGIRTIAEGIELAEEAAAALAVGFDLAQGFLFGRPGPLPGRPARPGA